ncbi:MAG: serine/threonine-protein kinase [Deinococcus sp.]|uniref:serine/threonine-protein kinase n=1 Tax=Deinococcus sp. TaxID=47478 RepID=UPI0026DADED9|nr:serine/threonine-protein kinase [Deinococcus sp.]MDO4247041.1 serine/threonine-protein kinase [Deinococcus sp.]
MPSLPAPEPVTELEVLALRSGVKGSRGLWRGEQVYVKTLVSDDPDRVAMFHHEGEVAARVSQPPNGHPLVTPLLRHTHDQLIFPFLPGGTLRDLARCGPMSAEAATEVTWGVLQAVAFLHARGVTHHDLKPENVLLVGGEARMDAVRLVDFGMSHATDLPLDIHSGTRMGTPHFMAPEQFQGVRGDPRSDLYSVGVLLFDCLAGHPPYEDALGWLVGISEERAAAPGPDALQPVILWAIQRDRSCRPQSAADLLGALGQARQALGLAALPDLSSSGAA